MTGITSATAWQESHLQQKDRNHICNAWQDSHRRQHDRQHIYSTTAGQESHLQQIDRNHISNSMTGIASATACHESYRQQHDRLHIYINMSGINATERAALHLEKHNRESHLQCYSKIRTVDATSAKQTSAVRKKCYATLWIPFFTHLGWLTFGLGIPAPETVFSERTIQYF